MINLQMMQYNMRGDFTVTLVHWQCQLLFSWIIYPRSSPPFVFPEKKLLELLVMNSVVTMIVVGIAIAIIIKHRGASILQFLDWFLMINLN